MMKCLLQLYIDQVEFISLLFKVLNRQISCCKQVCFSACFQEFATIFIDTFSSCMSSDIQETSCIIQGYLGSVSKFRF